jgi:ElaB/YqjD/DUF883 family membrane-anchored ribosome-binding protein
MDDYKKNYPDQGSYGEGTASSAGAAAATAEDKVSEKANELKDKVSDLGRKTVERIDQSRQSAASALEQTASSLHAGGEKAAGVGHSAADKFSSAGHSATDRVSGAAHSAADKLQATADYVRNNDLKAMGEDLQEMVTRYPGVSLAVAAALGFLVARSLSSRD